MPPMGWIPLSYLIQIWHRKTRVPRLQSGTGYNVSFSHFDTICKRDRHTDRHGMTAYSAVRVASAVKIQDAIC